MSGKNKVIHGAVKNQLRVLVQNGIVNVKEIQRELKVFVEKEFDPIPKSTDRAFYPTISAIKSCKGRLKKTMNDTLSNEEADLKTVRCSGVCIIPLIPVFTS